MAIDLSSVRKGDPLKPPRLLVYGTSGIGKTTLAAGAPNPIVIQTEDGLGMLDVPAFPLAKTYEDVREALAALCTQEHDYKTVIIDSVDWLETLIQTKIAEDHNKPSIASIDFGKGFGEALEIWTTNVLPTLDYLRVEKGMAVILIAHHISSPANDPTVDPYNVLQPKLHRSVTPKIQEWPDAVLFANYRITTTSADAGFNKKVTRAIGSGERVLYTEARPSFVAKNRYKLPPELPLSWASLAAELPYYNNQNKDK